MNTFVYNICQIIFKEERSLSAQTKKPQGLSNTLKYMYGVGDAGFILMSNIETFYFTSAGIF